MEWLKKIPAPDAMRNQSSADPVTTRFRIRVTGRVQGVGFRPTVFRLAAARGLSGCVRNTTAGVTIEAQGEQRAVLDFVAALKLRPPEQARIESFDARAIPPEHDGMGAGQSDFEIVTSSRSGALVAGMPPDLATCAACRAELFEPANRRYRYPFINCTNCGPRFSIIGQLPYDRACTSMASFDLCPKCRFEYEDPSNRRFEAQPNACPLCGPRARLILTDGSERTGDPFESAADFLRNGRIVALKGIGGYHLCCDALSDPAVDLLRRRKNRAGKPLAVMFSRLEEARLYAEISDIEESELSGCASPIVILRRKRAKDGGGARLSRLVSPDTDDIGAFLPYSPIHHLLLAETGPLVMTSGNRAGEPIAKDEEELKRLLGPVADAAIVHDRPILRRCDDSVLKIVEGKRLVFRRSRGIVPDPIPLPFSAFPVLACGADMKNTVCVTRGNQAFVSPHIGDLRDLRSYRFFIETIRDFGRLLQSRPALVAHDAHPGYLSTRYAREIEGLPLLAVQHHHAHIASCMAEHGLAGPVIGVALDGTGFGPDGTVWGGEFLVADFKSWRRAAHFRRYRMPGGEQAVLEPARMALSCLLSDLEETGRDALSRKLLPSITRDEWQALPGMIERGLRSPFTSSAGRLFDAVAALLGMPEPVSYEGQAAVRLQALAGRDETSSYPFSIESSGEMIVVSFRPMIVAVSSDVPAGVDRGSIADKFHNTVADAIAATCSIIGEREHLDEVVLSGGVFQNDLLLVRASGRLARGGFKVYSHRLVPPNDGGISLGQAAIAAARSEA